MLLLNGSETVFKAPDIGKKVSGQLLARRACFEQKIPLGISNTAECFANILKARHKTLTAAFRKEGYGK